MVDSDCKLLHRIMKFLFIKISYLQSRNVESPRFRHQYSFLFAVGIAITPLQPFKFKTHLKLKLKITFRGKLKTADKVQLNHDSTHGDVENGFRIVSINRKLFFNI